MAASVEIAGRDVGLRADRRARLVMACVREYREAMRSFAQVSHLDVWYERINASELVDRFGGRLGSRGRITFSTPFAYARKKTSLRAVRKLTERVDGEPRFRSVPPLLVRFADLHDPTDPRDESDYVRDLLDQYVASLDEDKRYLFGTYEYVDLARKVVGVGSVGTDDAVVLGLGDSDSDPLFLQVKQAEASVLEPFAGASRYANHGQRVVEGQRLMQAASDIFLGWTRIDGRDYYVRQLRDMKGSIPIEKLAGSELVDYARACGAVLARAHARSGDPLAIAAYLGSGAAFERAISQFAVAYADQTDSDHKRMLEAIRSGELQG
jgi:uncharacterized protein (DUF2252 family)